MSPPCAGCWKARQGLIHALGPWVPWLLGRGQLPLLARPSTAASPELPLLLAAKPLPCSQLWHQRSIPRCVPGAREGSRHPASESFSSGCLAQTNVLARKAHAIPAACCSAGCKQLTGLARGASQQLSTLLLDPKAGGSCKVLGTFLVQQKRDVSAGASHHLRGGQCVTLACILDGYPGSFRAKSGLSGLEDPANCPGSGAGCRTPAPRFFLQMGPIIRPVSLHRISPVHLTTKL